MEHLLTISPNSYPRPQSQFHLPPELLAVYRIFNADPELQRKALPYVDLERGDIDWYRISQNDFGGGHSAAITWAKAIWTDQTPEKSDPFDRAFSMGPRLQKAVLEALAIRWGLKDIDNSND
jgi:hypothetical protein